MTETVSVVKYVAHPAVEFIDLNESLLDEQSMPNVREQNVSVGLQCIIVGGQAVICSGRVDGMNLEYFPNARANILVFERVEKVGTDKNFIGRVKGS